MNNKELDLVRDFNSPNISPSPSFRSEVTTDESYFEGASCESYNGGSLAENFFDNNRGEGALNLPTKIDIPLEERPLFELYENLLGGFLKNIEVLSSRTPDSLDISTIQCVHPSAMLQKYLSAANNYHVEYEVLLNENLIILLQKIADSSANIRSLSTPLNGLGDLPLNIELSLRHSRDTLLEYYVNIFGSIHRNTVESIINGHLEPIIDNISNNPEVLLSCEITAFTGCLLVTLPPEKWAFFLESVLNFSANGSSLYHYHLVYTAWGSNIYLLPYDSFTNLFVNSTGVYSTIDSNFHSVDFGKLMAENFVDESNSIMTQAQNNTTSVVVLNNELDTAAFREFDQEDQVTLREIPNSLSWVQLATKLLRGVNWLVAHPTVVSVGLVITGGFWGILRQPLTVNPGPGVIVVLPQPGNIPSVPLEVAAIPSEPLPVATLPSTPISFESLPVLPDMETFVTLPVTMQVAVSTGYIIAVAVMTKKLGLIKILMSVWK